MSSKNNLKYKILADHTDFEKKMRRVATVAQDVGKTAGSALKIGVAGGALAAAAGMVALGAEMSKAIALANIQEEAESKLSSVLEATGNAAGYNRQQLFDMAGAMQGITTIGDEVTISGMAVLATFKEIRGEGFERATMAAMDMSTILKTDLNSAMVQIGKALNDPIKGMSALSRSGVSFTEQQKDQIKVLQESGNIMGAQAIILGELESEFGGAAAAIRETFGGSVTAAGNAFGDLQEQIGFTVTKNKFFIEGAHVAEQAFVNWTGQIKGNETAMMELSKTIAIGVIGAIDGIITGIEYTVLGWQGMKVAWNGTMSALVGGLASTIDFFNNGWSAIGYAASDTWLDIKFGALLAFDGITEGFAGVIEAIATQADALSFTIKNPFGDDWVVGMSGASASMREVAGTIRDASTATEDYAAEKERLSTAYQLETEAGSALTSELHQVSGMYAEAGQSAYDGMGKASTAAESAHLALGGIKASLLEIDVKRAGSVEVVKTTNTEIVTSDTAVSNKIIENSLATKNAQIADSKAAKDAQVADIDTVKEKFDYLKKETVESGGSFAEIPKVIIEEFGAIAKQSGDSLLTDSNSVSKNFSKAQTNIVGSDTAHWTKTQNDVTDGLSDIATDSKKYLVTNSGSVVENFGDAKTKITDPGGSAHAMFGDYNGLLDGMQSKTDQILLKGGGGRESIQSQYNTLKSKASTSMTGLSLDFGSKFDDMNTKSDKILLKGGDGHESMQSQYKTYATKAKTAIGDVVGVFTRGEGTKEEVARLASGKLTEYATSAATTGLTEILSALGSEIGAWVGLGTAQTSTEGSTWGEKIATGAGYLAQAGISILAGKALGDTFAADGGWIGSNPGGGVLKGGSGTKDDIFLGYTDGGSTRNWGMGGEFVINKEATAKYLPELVAINNNKFEDGGPVADAMPPTHRINDSGFDTFLSTVIETKGNWQKAIVDAIAYYAGTAAGMLTGKALGPKIMGYAKGGQVRDRAFGWGGFLDDLLDPGELFHDSEDGFIPSTVPWLDPGSSTIIDSIGGIFGRPQHQGPFDNIQDYMDYGFVWDTIRNLPVVGESAKHADNILFPFVRDVITPGGNVTFGTIGDMMKGVFAGIEEEVKSIITGGFLSQGSFNLFNANGGPIGQFHDGTNYVPESGSYYLERGEKVVPDKYTGDEGLREEVRQLKDEISRIGFRLGQYAQEQIDLLKKFDNLGLEVRA